jgi:DNA replication protein DnaC
MARWDRYDLIAIDEVGYVPMADLGAEFLLQVIADDQSGAKSGCHKQGQS